MVGLRLQTKFLLSMLLVSAGLTATTLLVVSHTIHAQVRREILRDLENSVRTFQSFQRQRETMLSQSTELLADLPTVRALMTTHDAATIQDASTDVWRLSGCDLFVLADSGGKIMALDLTSQGLARNEAQNFLARSLQQDGAGQWWYGDGHLYEVFVRPIFFGAATEDKQLGFLAAGYEIDDHIAQDIGRLAASQVAFRYGDKVVRSTLAASQVSEMTARLSTPTKPGTAEQNQLRLGTELYLATTVELSPNSVPAVQLSVLKSFDQETAFLDALNRLLLAMGLLAVAGGSFLVYLISNTFTGPLKNLVSGVRALEHGDYAYPLEARGNDEVAELTTAFSGMRTTLGQTQRDLIDAERLATIGRMASSISHDLRHSLASILANSEFLCEADLKPSQREELYQEVRNAVNRMTDLIESLLDFSRTRESMRPSLGSVRKTLERAIGAVKAHPAYHNVEVQITGEGGCDGWFDAVKLERAFQNLILNSCEAISRPPGHIRVNMKSAGGTLEIFVADDGSGIPESIRPKLFEPFVSFGKENGTGMGLTVVQKIVQDHGGSICVMSTSSQGTVFRLSLPLPQSPEPRIVLQKSAD